MRVTKWGSEEKRQRRWRLQFSVGRTAGFIALTVFCFVSRITVDANQIDLSAPSFFVTAGCVIAGWAALMCSPFRRVPSIRADSACVWVGAMGFAVQASIVFVTWLLVRDARVTRGGSAAE